MDGKGSEERGGRDRVGVVLHRAMSGVYFDECAWYRSAESIRCVRIMIFFALSCLLLPS